MIQKEPKRFWSKVDVCEVDECWEWLAYKDPKGMVDSVSVPD